MCVCCVLLLLLIFINSVHMGEGASYVIDNIGMGLLVLFAKRRNKKMLIIYAKYTYTLRSESDRLMYSLSIKFSIRFLMMAGLG